MTRPGSIELRQVSRPEITDSYVLIQVQQIGVCGSDIMVTHRFPFKEYLNAYETI
jgi:D-arabinose 1-dehydrogenase-like Zn-dependent alcohol dehydrogenase